MARDRHVRRSCLLAILIVVTLAGGPTGAARAAGGQAAAPFLDRYERGEPAIADGAPPSEGALHNLQVLLTRTAPAWIKALGPAEEPRRRLATAAYVLDILKTETAAPQLWKVGQPAADLLEWACELVRKEPLRPAADGGAPRPPLEEERSWFLASIALLERVGLASDALGEANGQTNSLGHVGSAPIVRELLELHVDHAAARFPDESRWALDRAVALELHTWPEPRDDHAFHVAPALGARLLTEYANAAAVAGVRQEALVRWGEFELRRGSPAKALEYLDQAGTPDDVYVRYWLHLLRGRALERVNRLTDAIASYHLALGDAPLAQSATMALAAALLADHRIAEASSIAAGALRAEPQADPWHVYLCPDWRFLPAALADVRKAVTR